MATTINADDDPKPTEPAPTAPTTTNHHPATQPPSKLKRFRFTVKYDLNLLKCIRAVNAHLPTWGKTDALYEEVRQLFLKAVPTALFEHSQRPSGKTLADRFKRLIRKRREDVKRTSSASGIIKEHVEQEQLLDDLVLEIDEKKESVRAENEEQTEKEAQLVAAWKSIREMALMRKTNLSSVSEAGDAAGAGDAGDSTTSSARKRKKREMSTSDDDIAASLIEQSAKRRHIETRRIDLEQERIEIELHRAEQEAERLEKLQESTDRRLDLDEKRFAVEVEERKKR